MRIALLAAAMIAAPAFAETQAATDDMLVDAQLVGKEAGAPKNCLTRYEAERMSVQPGRVLFRVNRNLTYVNDLNQCSTLRADDILQTNLYGTGRLCRGDIVQIIDRTGGFGRGACSWGDFVPYRTPK